MNESSHPKLQLELPVPRASSVLTTRTVQTELLHRNKDLFEHSPSQSQGKSSIYLLRQAFSSSITPRRRGLSTGNFPSGEQRLKSLFCVIQKRWIKCFLSFSAADTQKWRPWELLTLYRSLWKTSKGLFKDKRSHKGTAPSSINSSQFSQILQYISLEKRNARSDPKPSRKKDPMVLIPMETKQKNVGKALMGCYVAPNETNGKTARNFKWVGTKALPWNFKIIAVP